MANLFGTDGIRGIAGIDLTPKLAFDVGFALGTKIKKNSSKCAIAIGKDTRISSGMLEAATAAGICAAGVDAILLGIVPTPVVSFAILNNKLQGGIMISASHNSFEYNGLKVFNQKGEKYQDEEEKELENLIKNQPFEKIEIYFEIGQIYRDETIVDEYITNLSKNLNNLFKTKKNQPKIAIDCANGSASITAKYIFKNFNSNINILNQSPNGININETCGSTNMEKLRSFVTQNDYDIGLAFDGDADRCLAVTKQGKILSGDCIILIIARMLDLNGMLLKSTIVTTKMSNLGLIEKAKEFGINVVITDVGDKYIINKMLSSGYVLGGESSGHLISICNSKTGDGQLTACLLLMAIDQLNIPFDKLYQQLEEYPQVLKNVKVKNKDEVLNDEVIQNFINKIAKKLENYGRVLLRTSGTEPVVRILVEGKDLSLVQECSNELVSLVKERFGI